MALIIRNAGESDAEVLRELAYKCPPLDLHTPYTYWVVTKMFGKHTFLAFDNDKPVGYIMCVKNSECLLIWQIGILEEYRKQKISHKLIKNVFDSLDGERPCPVMVSIAAENRDSYRAFLSFCECRGYTMREKSYVSLKDPLDLHFHENEILYEINK